MAFLLYRSPLAALRECLSTDEDCRQAVARSCSIAQVLGHIGLVPAGGNYKTVQQRISQLGLNTSHFTGAARSQGERYRAFRKPPALEDLLRTGSTCQAFKRKKSLLKGGLLQPARASCQLSE